MPGSITNWIIGAGLALIIIGLIAKTGMLSWFGQLPGDIHIQREGFQLYFPLMSMILISVALSALVAVVRRFFP
jgi:membrane protein implicated in regulation of membrane protease activity